MFSFKIKSTKKSERKILIGLLSMLTILISITFLTHRNSKRVIASAEAVDNSQEIKYHFEQVLALASEIESASRGYVITGDEKFLEQTNNGINTVYVHLDEIKSLTQNDKILSDRLHNLTALLSQRILVVNRANEIRREEGLEKAMAFVSKGEGKNLMNKIRVMVNSIIADEDVKLAEERAENKDHIFNFNTSFDLLVLKIAISILTMFFILRYYFRVRRNAEEELKENKELLQRIVDNTTAVIFIKDLEGKYLLINSRYEQLFNITQEQIKGKTDYDLFPKEVADAVRLADMEVVRNNKLIEVEEDVPNNGEMRNYISIKFPLHDKDNKVYAVCGMATDITERKELENALRLRNHEILDLFNNAPCGYHSINKDGIVIEMNETELNWLGYSRYEVVGKMDIRDLMTIDSMMIFETQFPKLLHGDEDAVRGLRITMRRKNGTEFPVEVNAIAVFDADGNFLHTRSSIFDVTHRLQADAIIFQN
jgi:PAS domain S-box-containing protein